jgi:hypothetical protein
MSTNNALHIDLLEVPLELDDLHQLPTIVPGLEPPGLRLHQHRPAQVQVPLSSLELNLLHPSILSRLRECLVWAVLGMSGVCLHLVEVLFSSSLSLCPFGVKVDIDLDQGFLRNLGLLLPHGEGLLPTRQLILLCQRRRRRRTTQSKHRRSMTHQEISLATNRNGQNPTCSPRSPSGRLPPSLSEEVVAIGCRGWNPRSKGASCNRHHGPF